MARQTEANPKTEARDAVLETASKNIDGHDVIEGLLWAVEGDIRTATTEGPGLMVHFEDYNEVAL